jgi:aminoglycoside phosphotransferase (APT) family kinase protein
VFVAGEDRPRFVVKLGRLRPHDEAIRTEHRNLTRLAALTPHGRVRTPEPLLCWEDDGRPCLVQSVLEGSDLWRANSRARSLAPLDPLVDWLIHLARATAAPGASFPATTFARLIDRAAGLVGPGQDRQMLQTLGRRLDTWPTGPLPRVFEHDDLGTWNVMLAPDGSLGVLDWESSRPEGLPAVDLFYFLAYYGALMEATDSTPGRLRSFVATFFGHGPFARIARSAVRRYAEAMSLPHAWLGPLFLTCWLQQAITDVARQELALADSIAWQMLRATLERDGQPSFLEGA